MLLVVFCCSCGSLCFGLLLCAAPGVGFADCCVGLCGLGLRSVAWWFGVVVLLVVDDAAGLL